MFWNAQGGEAEHLQIPAPFPHTKEEKNKIHNSTKTFAYFCKTL